MTGWSVLSETHKPADWKPVGSFVADSAAVNALLGAGNPTEMQVEVDSAVKAASYLFRDGHRLIKEDWNADDSAWLDKAFKHLEGLQTDDMQPAMKVKGSTRSKGKKKAE